MYHDELVKRTQRTTTLAVALAIITALQGVSMFFGLRDLLPARTAEGVVIPLVVGAGVAIGFWFVWHWLLSVVPLTHAPARRALGVLAGAALTLISIGTSSWFIASAVGGSRAVQMHMNEYLSNAGHELGNLNANAAAEQSLTGLVSEIAAGWRGIAEREAKYGTVSGKTGEGPRTSVLRSAASSFEQLQQEINERFAEFGRARAQADATLADLTKLANSPAGATTDGQTRFSALAAGLYQQFAAMERISALPLVEQRGIVLVNETNGAVVTHDESQTKRLHGAVRKLQAERKPVSNEPYRPISKAMATLDYADSVAGPWIMGVGLDVIPFVMLLILLLAFSEAREPYQPRRHFEVIGGGREVA
jgi:hypothetical protein